MECFGPQCATMLLEWIEQRARQGTRPEAARPVSLFTSVPYDENAPLIRSPAELDGTLEHLEYAVFRRYQNQLTRAERGRLDNTIDNALFKVEGYLRRLNDDERNRWNDRLEPLRAQILESRDRAERQRGHARRAEERLAQLASLTPEAFEEFVAELFEALGYQVERTGGTGDEGVDLRLQRQGLTAVVQCKYYSRGVIGSPELQKFLGTVHHTRSHKGFYVTTRTFSLAAEKFAAENPLELIDGPRLSELVREALGPVARTQEPVWFS